MSASRFAAAVVTVGLAVAVLTAPSGAASKTVRNGLIAYTVGNGDEEPFVIKTIRPNGTQNRTLLRPDRKFPGGPAAPRWSRDGKKLLFARYPDDSFGDQRVRSLWYSTPAGKQIRRIPLGPRRVLLGGYDWAPGRSPHRLRGHTPVFADGHNDLHDLDRRDAPQGPASRVRSIVVQRRQVHPLHSQSPPRGK